MGTGTIDQRSYGHSSRQNGTWTIHVFIAKEGYPLNPSDNGYKKTTITYQYKCKWYCQGRIKEERACNSTI